MPKTLLENEQKALFALSRLLEETGDFDKILRSYLWEIRKSLHWGRISLMLVDEKGAELFLKESFGLKLEIRKKTRQRIGEGIAGWVAKEGRPLFVRNIASDTRFRGEKKASGFRSGSFLSIPVKTRRRLYGVLNAAEKESGKPFNEDEFKMFRVLGEALALFLENQWLAGRLHETKRLSVDEIADLSHEFKIPLTCLQEALAILRDEIPGSLNEKQKQYLEMAQQNIGRMNERVNLFIREAKDAAQDAPSKPERKRIDLARWSEEILGAFKAKAERSGIRLRRGSDTPEIKIWGDPERLGEVLTNFIDNAIKYSKPRGEVLLKATQTRGRIRMAVEDHGRGIPKEEQKKIFDRFYRLKKARESGVEGHGLGLALCQEIVKAHGGTIGVESTEGQGSIFWFEIPAVPPKVQEVR